MRYTNFPRNRDEWLEPPDDDGSSEKIADFISETYTEVGCGCYYDHDNGEIVQIEEDEFEVDEDGRVIPYTSEVEGEELFELAIHLIEQFILKGEKE